MTVTLLPSNHT